MSSIRHILKHGVMGLVACSSALPGLAQTEPFDLGTLTKQYYRSTQLQGHLMPLAGTTPPAYALMTIPSFLTGTDIDVTYTKRLDSHGSVMAQEIPFVDTFSVARFLGGYKPVWLPAYGLWNPALANASMDYAYVNYLGATTYQTAQISQRLGPFITAGYTIDNVTIGIENILWNYSQNGGHLNGGYDGVFGQNLPAADSTYATWTSIIKHFCADLATLYPGAPSFKIGNEYDSRESFNSDYSNFLSFYTSSYAAINSYFPVSGATAIVPGEFTFISKGFLYSTDQIYDENVLLTDAAAAGMAPKYAPRSLNGSQNINYLPVSSPASAVSRAVGSYAALSSHPVPVITQCGILGQPFSATSGGSDQGGRQAAWEFQVLMGLRKGLAPIPTNATVYHWDTFAYVENVVGGVSTTYPFLNGNGVVDMYLDYNCNQGYQKLYWMPPTTGSSLLSGDEVMAVCFLNQSTGATRLMLSTWRESANQTPIEITITLTDGTGGTPNLLSTHTNASWSGMRYGTNNVFTQIQADLQAANNSYLTTSSVWNLTCVAAPYDMARDPVACSTMVASNYTAGSNYVNIMKNSLKIHPTSWLPTGYWISAADNTVHVMMNPNEILYLQ